MNIDNKKIDWLAVDWGTSTFRAWAMTSDGTILESCQNSLGMSGLKKSDYETVLLQQCGSWFTDETIALPVVVCGMAGSREGWLETPYESVPCSMHRGIPSHSVDTTDNRISVHIVAGLKQTRPADVMRGEETQIFGLVTQQPDFNGVLVLPGTHTKWAWIKQQSVERFSTYMTGELFAVLNHHSVLKHSLTTNHFSEPDFDQAVLACLENPARMTQQLFELRALSVLENTAPEKLRARLSGSLIGMELSSMKSLLKNEIRVSIIGMGALATLYQRALRLMDINSQIISVESVTLAGLHAAYLSLA